MMLLVMTDSPIAVARAIKCDEPDSFFYGGVDILVCPALFRLFIRRRVCPIASAVGARFDLQFLQFHLRVRLRAFAPSRFTPVSCPVSLTTPATNPAGALWSVSSAAPAATSRSPRDCRSAEHPAPS